MIGRKIERKKLDILLKSNKAEMLAIIGRRRVGKTFLIREHYKNQIIFEFTDTQYSDKKNQLKKFSHKLSEYQNSPIPTAIPND